MEPINSGYNWLGLVREEEWPWLRHRRLRIFRQGGRGYDRHGKSVYEVLQSVERDYEDSRRLLADEVSE